MPGGFSTQNALSGTRQGVWPKNGLGKENGYFGVRVAAGNAPVKLHTGARFNCSMPGGSKCQGMHQQNSTGRKTGYWKAMKIYLAASMTGRRAKQTSQTRAFPVLIDAGKKTARFARVGDNDLTSLPI